MNDRPRSTEGLTALELLAQQCKNAEDALRESEKRYRLLAENVGDAIWAINFDLEPTYISPSIINLLGYTAEEAMSRTRAEIFSPASLEYILQVYREEMSAPGTKDPNRSRTFEVDLIHKDGSIVPVELTCKLIFDEEGNPCEIIVSAHNISDRRRAFDMLRHNEEKYRHIIENLNEAVYCIDLNGMVTYISPTIQAMLGYRPDEIRGRHFSEFIHPADREKGRIHYESTLSRAIAPLECRFLTRSGETVWLYASSVPDRRNGEVAGIQGILQDITEFKIREVELNQANEKLRDSISSMVQVMASIVELKDSYTARHQLRVTKLACNIAYEMGLPRDQVDGIRAAGLVHDIGKLNIPLSILSKSEAINDIEYELIKSHPLTGYELLKPIGFPWPVPDIVFQHHERLDGSGYPRGLSGEEILPEARIIAVADVMEAISTRRPYREGSSVASALQELSAHSGRLYDAGAVEACLRLFNEKSFTFE